MNFEQVISRHEKIALQVSGGRDSIACLYLMRPYLDRLTVYWCNTGAAFPETVDVMRAVRNMVPNFVEIDGNQPHVVEQFGMPSDIVPVSHSISGLLARGALGREPLLQDRYSCCYRTMMLPTHERMIADGITLIIRGQKNVDTLKSDLRSGQVVDGIEVLFPIEDWDSRRVMSYLREKGAPIPRYYEMMDGAPDCMTCSAYWENGAAAYLKRYHHGAYQEVQRRLDIINAAVAPSIANFNIEVNT